MRLLAATLAASFVASLLGLAFAPAARAEAAHMKPGLYEFSASMEMEGMGAHTLPTTSRCISPDEAANPQHAVKPPEGCVITEMKMVGATAHWSVSCHMHGGSQTGSGEVVFGPESMKTTTRFEMTDPRGGGHVMKMTQHSDAHRVGDCTPQR